MRTRLEQVYALWEARPCFLCGALGKCPDRELAVDLALIAAEEARASRLAAGDDPRQLRLFVMGAAA